MLCHTCGELPPNFELSDCHAEMPEEAPLAQPYSTDPCNAIDHVRLYYLLEML